MPGLSTATAAELRYPGPIYSIEWLAGVFHRLLLFQIFLNDETPFVRGWNSNASCAASW